MHIHSGSKVHINTKKWTKNQVIKANTRRMQQTLLGMSNSVLMDIEFRSGKFDFLEYHFTITINISDPMAIVEIFP